MAINAESDEKDQMRYRVGINIVDVMVSNDNLFGDAVNIAARLEAQAISDGICISDNIYDLVNLKVKVSYEDAGELELKNIGRPIKAYNVLKCKGATRGLRSDDAAPQVKIESAEPGSLAVMLFKNLSSDEDQEYTVLEIAKILIKIAQLKLSKSGTIDPSINSIDGIPCAASLSSASAGEIFLTDALKPVSLPFS